MEFTLRQRVGSALCDWPRFEGRLRSSWPAICNRHEKLDEAPDGNGFACAWQWTSELHVANVFPRLGGRLLSRALEDWPIEFSDEAPGASLQPDVSFVVGHRGGSRVPQLLATLSTLAAQRGVSHECIVVEQSTHQEVRDQLPAWVRYLHTPLPNGDVPFCRAWALNAGARMARGELLVFHDNDMLAPAAYAACALRKFRDGFEAINLKRFVFYMREHDSARIQSDLRLDGAGPPAGVVQNLEAGGSVAVGRDAFFEIGGYDESFVGWGGEDNEFWERALLRRTWPYANLPIVHLWHASQPGKARRDNPTLQRYAALSAQPPSERIALLKSRDFGRSDMLSVPWPTLPAPSVRAA